MGEWQSGPGAVRLTVLSPSDPTRPTRPRRGPSPHRSLSDAQAGAEQKVRQARRALDELERRNERATEKVDLLTRRKQALELELADAESERDRTHSRLGATRAALEAAEARLLALRQEAG